jgi:hypothetical protein
MIAVLGFLAVSDSTFVSSSSFGGPVVWVAIGALAVSLATFVGQLRDSGRRDRAEYLDQLEERVASCERDRTALHKDVVQLRNSLSELRDENIALMRRLVKHEGQ